MRVAFFSYPHSFQTPGGGEILLLKTKQALEEKGISVKLFNQWEDKLEDFDMLHVFGSVKDCLGLIQCAKARKVKIVLSPVFWSTLQRSFCERASLPKKIKMSAQHLIKVVFPIFPSERKKMLELADVILPNSYSEARQVSRLFAVPMEKMHIVYLAADERFSEAAADEFITKYGVKDFILSVGRIEPRKNQLNLIKAAKDLNNKLVIIGDVVLGYEKYYDECKHEAAGKVLFISGIKHEDNLLASAYAASRIFVLQSWFETPGLAAIEAGFAGANLAVTRGGSTAEYFKDYIEYFNPASAVSIRKAINRALLKEKTNNLKKYLLDNFTWEKAASENIKVYKQILS